MGAPVNVQVHPQFKIGVDPCFTDPPANIWVHPYSKKTGGPVGGPISGPVRSF